MCIHNPFIDNYWMSSRDETRNRRRKGASRFHSADAWTLE